LKDLEADFFQKLFLRRNNKLSVNIHDRWAAGLPDFSWYNIPKRGKIYQINIKLQQNIANGRKKVIMAVK
jgi:hypothetical protein